MSQPTFRRNPETGEIEEYQPVVVNRDALAAQLDDARKAQADVNGTVKALEERRIGLEDQHKAIEDELVKVDDTLKVAYTEQEAEAEKVAFRTAKLAAYDELLAADPAPADEPASEVAENDAVVPTAGQPSAEEVADTLGLEEPADEPEAASEEVVLPVRRRATV